MTTIKSMRVAIICILGFQAILIVLFSLFTEYDTSTDVPQLSDSYPMFQDIHVMIFIGFGFLMTFLKRYSFSAVGFNFLIAAVVIQWAMLCLGFYRMDHGSIKLNIMSLVNADIAAAAILISFGAVLGKVSPVQLLFMAIIETALFAANEYIGTHMLKAIDAGGSIFVHTFGAYFGLSMSLVLGSSWARSTQENKLEGSSYTSDIFSMIGTIFLWMFWPSFNAALVTGDQRHRAVVNTYLSIAASCVTAFAFSALCNKNNKFEMVHIQNATLAGGVCVGAAADLVIKPFGALLIGSYAGILSTLGYRFLQGFLLSKLKLHDTCGVHNLHGMPGVTAGLISAVVVTQADKSTYGTEWATTFPELAAGRSPGGQAAAQLSALGVTMAFAVVGGLVTGLFLKVFPCRIAAKGYFNDALLWELEDEDHADSEHDQQATSTTANIS